MRMLWVFVFLFLPCFLQADWDQLFSDEEDPTLFHHVNVITGNLNLCLQDAVIEGAKTLPIFRTYSSAGALESSRLNAELKGARGGWMVQGGWNFFPHTDLLIEISPKPRKFHIYIAEPSGNLISYSFSRKQGGHVLIFKPSKGSASGAGQCSGNLSAKTNSSNNVLRLNLKNGEAILLLPNGGSRVYKGQSFRHWDLSHFEEKQGKGQGRCFYCLKEEILPSGHKIDYSYDGKKRLDHIALKNPSGTKTFAWIHLGPIGKHSPIAFSVKTSDGKSLHYKTTSFKEIDYISSVQSSHRAEEVLTYAKGRKGTGSRIQQMTLGGKLQFEATYYLPPNAKKEEQWVESPEKKYFETDKVRMLEAPLGPHGEKIPLAQFLYFPNVTEVRDNTCRLIRYHHDGGQLTSIEYCDDTDTVVSRLNFLWEGGRLKAKVMLNGQSQAQFSKAFTYDAVGNVTKETLWGSLTGSISGPFLQNPDGSLEGAEHTSRSYEYLPCFNLPILEEEENGLSYQYEYKPGTDLLTALFTSQDGHIFMREFFFYDEDHLLIAKVTDDGDSKDPNSLSRVTERQIKRYTLDPQSGLVQSLTEAYLDLSSHAEIPLKTITYTYSPEHRVIKETIYDANGTYRSFLLTDYDAQGRVIRQTNPGDQENSYSYDSLGQLVAMKEVSSPKKLFAYDEAGRPASVEEVDSFGTVKKTFTRYDSKGNLLEQTDSKGNTTTQTYDAFGRCILTEFPLATDEKGEVYTPSVTFTYDLQGNLTSTSILGGGTTHTSYNTLRKPTYILQADGTTIRHFYSKNGTLIQTVHPDGTQMDYLYDPFQRMISKKVTSDDGHLLSTETWGYNTFHLLSHTDPNGLTTDYIYDDAGRKISEKAGSHLITYLYDSFGLLERTTEAGCTLIQRHDNEGKVIEERQETLEGTIENHMWFSYDHENRKSEAMRMTSQGATNDLFVYDRESRLTLHLDPQKNISEILYSETHTNALGQRVLQKTIIDPLKNETEETYDALNRLVSRRQKDPQGNIVSQEEFSYDRAGNQAKRVSTVYHLHTPKHHTVVSWKHDLMGRVIQEKEGTDKTTHFAYDTRGRLIRRLMPNGTSIDSTYDGLDRLLEMQSSDGTIHYQYTYASGPEPIAISDLIHHTELTRSYNLFGQLVRETNPYGLTSTWEYDLHGRCITHTLPDLSSIAYTYQGNHLKNISRLSPLGDLLYTHHYSAFDVNGHISEEELIHNVGSLHTIHDLLERPSQQSSPFLTHSVSYGPSGLILQRHNSLLGDKTYAYDALNQLMQEDEVRYHFDSLGNPTQCTLNEYNQILEGPSYSLEYDPNGNPIKQISSQGITTYTYDALNRLNQITRPDSTTTTYAYDPFNHLISETRNGTPLFYLYDKAQEIGAMDAQGKLLELKVLGLGPKGEIGRSVAIEIRGTAYAPLHDFQGNIIALIAPDRTIAEFYQFDAFGREQNRSTPLNPWRFSAKRSTNGLIFFGQRFYDPNLGRWLTPDPSGFADGANLYVYVLNSPLNRLDLFGLESDPRFLPYDMRIEVPMGALLNARLSPTPINVSCKAMISGVSVDWVLSSGLWNKLQFTPQEKETGMVNIVDHFHELVPQEGKIVGLITSQNGICTSKKELNQNVEAVSRMVPEGTLIIGMYNPTKGLIRDCKRTFRERKGKDTPIVTRTRQFMTAISDTLHKLNPDLLWLHMAHSEGGVIGRNAINGMADEQKEQLNRQLYYLGVAPAKPMPLNFGKGVTNIYSNRDFVTGGFALKYRNDPRYDVRFVRCISPLSQRTAYFADHRFLGPTYQKVQADYIEKLRDSEGFYDGKMR